MLFVSHDPAMVLKYCQNAVLLNGGEMVLKGPVEEVVPATQKN